MCRVRFVLAAGVYALVAGCSSSAPPEDMSPVVEPPDQPTEHVLEVTATDVATDPASVIRAGSRYLATRRPAGAEGDDRVILFDTMLGTTTPILGADVAGSTDYVLSQGDVLLRGDNDGIYHFQLTRSVEAQRVGRPALAPNSGRMDTDGGPIVAFVTSEPFVCWIDMTAETLEITPFVRPPLNGTYAHTAVHGTRVAALDGPDLVLFDTALGPFSEPVVFDVSASSDVPIVFDGTTVVFADIDYVVYALDVDAEQATQVPIGLSLSAADDRLQVDLAGGTMCSFEGTRPIPFASLVGTPGATVGAIEVGLNSPTDPGWGSRCAVEASGARVFISGSPGSETLLSMWEDGLAASIEGPQGPFSCDRGPHRPGLAAFQIHDGAGNSSLGYIDLKKPDPES